MEKIVLENFSVGGKCDIFHHGVLNDCLQKSNYTFNAGNLYGIIGEFGNGGAALSCGITGKTDYYEGSIYIDGNEIYFDELKNISWYIGDDLKKKRNFLKREMTVKEQIIYGLNHYNRCCDFEIIKQQFNLSTERIDRCIEYVSGERWKASCAIGYANGKEIFCFPLMNTNDYNLFGEQFKSILNVLLDSMCVVIMPTTKEDNIKKISSNYCALYL